MKNIKKIALLFCLISTITFAKSDEDGVHFFENKSSETANAGPSDPDPGADPAAPINDYLPLLLIGAGLVALRYRNQLLKN